MNETIMNYDEFLNWLLDEELTENAENNYFGITEIVAHNKGERASAWETERNNFIRQTNVKYYGKESNVLMGDFIEAKIGMNFDKQSFVRFSVENLYDAYKEKGMLGVSDVIANHCAYANSIESRVSRVIDDMKTYETIKDNLIIRPLNFDYNKEMLDGMTYKRIGDIALVLYAVVFDDVDSGALNTVKVPRVIFNGWNIDESVVFAMTMRNTNGFAVPELFRNLLDITSYDAFMAEGYCGTLSPSCSPMVTTHRRTNGAIALFYDGVCKKIAEMFGGSFYVAFTSIHEAMCHKEGSIPVEGIRRHVRATNAAFGKEETLSNEVWYYNAKTDSFSMVI